MVEGRGVCWNFLKHTFSAVEMGKKCFFVKLKVNEIGRLISFWDELFSGAMLVLGSVIHERIWDFASQVSDCQNNSFHLCKQIFLNRSSTHSIKSLGSFQSFVRVLRFDGSEIPIPTTVWMYKNPVNYGMFHHQFLNF